MKKTQLLILFLFSNYIYAAQAPWVGVDLKGLSCSGKGQGYGPFDYTKAKERGNIPIVEEYHFTAEVENHVSGHSGSLAGDLDYTLRAVPNHQRALLSLIRYQLKLNKKLISGSPLESPVECYLQRAIHFSPSDAASLSLYAYYLKEIGQHQQAADHYQKALTIAPNNAKIEYSYSLLLVDLKQYDKALEYAEKAYEHGKPPNGLKNKLIKLGVWKKNADK
jgi:tetratricopeptide (TPR) repeat protein